MSGPHPSHTPPLPPRVRSGGGWFAGPIFQVRRDPLKWIPTWLEEYGDIFRIKAPLGQATIVGTPGLARQVLVDRYSHYQSKSRAYAVLRILMGDGLVTSEGEFWRRQRKLVQPAFHRRRLEALFGMMVERVSSCVRRFEDVAAAGRAVDLTPLLSQLTLDVISRAMFSSDVQGAAADVSRHISTLNGYALRMLRRPWLFLLPRRFPTPFNRTQVHALRSLDQIVRDIIQRRRTSGEPCDDLLGMLLTATEEGSSRGMTDRQLHDEMMTIFVAGHETTANAMAWLLYQVSMNPEVEERLFAEIDSNWPDAGLSMEGLAQFPFVRQVIEESLRLYPSIWSVGRRCTEPDELGGCRIPLGMNVVIPIFHIHRSGRYWENPDRFDPDRFGPDRRPSPESMVYFPFGAGPRSCIGNHFALQELMIMTVQFFRHFRFQVEPGFAVTAEPLITLQPKHGMRMILRNRNRTALHPVS